MAPAIGADEYNLALVYMKAERFSDTVASLDLALRILRSQNSPRAMAVGYALLADAAAYAGTGDQAKANQLRSAAVQILGPALGSRQAPRSL